MTFTSTQLSPVVGKSRGYLEAIKRYAYGTRDDPFKGGRYSTPQRINAWIMNHPEFRASLAWAGPARCAAKSRAGKMSRSVNRT